MDAASGVLFVIRAISLAVIRPSVLITSRISVLASLYWVCSLFGSVFIVYLTPCRVLRMWCILLAGRRFVR